MTKNLVLSLTLTPLAQIWVPNIYLWILPLLDVRHCCKLSTFSHLINILRKAVWDYYQKHVQVTVFLFKTFAGTQSLLIPSKKFKHMHTL